MAGRPSKRTTETEKAILDALRAGATDIAACTAAGIDQDTFIRWRAKTADFAESVSRARAQGRLWHELNVRKSAEGDGRLSLEWLARRYPADWAKRDELTVTIRQQAERLAAELGLNAADVLAEAERIVGAGSST